MEQVVKDFGIQWPLVLASILNFVILVLLLKKFLYKPVLKVLDERKETVEKSLRNAEWIEQEKKKTEERVKASLRLANEQSIKTMEQAKKTAEKLKQSIIKEAEEQATAMINRAKAEIEQKKEEVTKSIRKDAANLVAMSLKKIMRETDLKVFDEKLVKETLEQIDG
jgi:F-type H+-transporting ATPase subunit b